MTEADTLSRLTEHAWGWLEETVADVSVYIHGGEIAVLKGLQGGVGYNESEAFRAAVEVIDES